MKRFGMKALAMLVALAIMIPLMSFTMAAEAVERIDLNIGKITIGVKQSVKTVKPTAYPDGASTTFTWESADENIAKVNSKGKITGVKKGTTTITVTAENGVRAELDVTVVKKNKGVKKITISRTASMTPGNTVALKVKFNPAKPANKDIIWLSSDESIATVDEKGKVTGVSVGKATITAISSSGKSAKCTVTVIPVKVKKIKLSGNKSMLRGETQTLDATVLPSNAENKALKWKSSNKKVASVDKNGVITAHKKGTATITATAKDGSKVKSSFKITVKKGEYTPDPTLPPDFQYKDRLNVVYSCKDFDYDGGVIELPFELSVEFKDDMTAKLHDAEDTLKLKWKFDTLTRNGAKYDAFICYDGSDTLPFYVVDAGFEVEMDDNGLVLVFKPKNAAPSPNPTAEPTAKPTAEPTAKPTAKPTAAPTEAPTAAPTKPANYVLRMATCADRSPYSYIDENGDIMGIDIGIAQYMCNHLGYELEIINASYNMLPMLLVNGSADFLLAAFPADPGYSGMLDYSDPYLENFVMAFPKSSPYYNDCTTLLAQMKEDGVIDAIVDEYKARLSE